MIPGFPQLKLWPDTVAALNIEPSELTLLHPRVLKRAQRVSLAFPRSPKPLQGIYVLDQGETHSITLLPRMEAFSEIVRHSYPTRFIGKAGLTPSFFQNCLALTQAIPVYRFRRKRSLALLSEARDLLDAHLRGEC